MPGPVSPSSQTNSTIQWKKIRAGTVFWRTLPQSCKVLPTSWHCNYIFKGHFTVTSSQLLQDHGERGKASEFQEDGTIVTILLLRSKLLDLKQRSLEYPDSGSGRHSLSQWAAVWQNHECRKAKFIPRVHVYSCKVKTLPVHDGTSPM